MGEVPPCTRPNPLGGATAVPVSFWGAGLGTAQSPKKRKKEERRRRANKRAGAAPGLRASESTRGCEGDRGRREAPPKERGEGPGGGRGGLCVPKRESIGLTGTCMCVCVCGREGRMRTAGQTNTRDVCVHASRQTTRQRQGATVVTGKRRGRPPPPKANLCRGCVETLFGGGGHGASGDEDGARNNRWGGEHTGSKHTDRWREAGGTHSARKGKRRWEHREQKVAAACCCYKRRKLSRRAPAAARQRRWRCAAAARFAVTRRRAARGSRRRAAPRPP